MIAALAALFHVSAEAQDLDPTVEVRRSYEGKLVEKHKPALTMDVPDSVQRFDLDFDYSVFDSPYRGAYEFKPYLLDFRPSSHISDARRLYLRAGAGYQLHPELDVVWSPFARRSFGMDVYASHRSFIGRYLPVENAIDTPWNGYDLHSKAGVSSRTDWEKASLRFDVGYFGIAQGDFLRKRSYNALDVNMGISSKSSKDEFFLYDINIGYRLSGDGVSPVGARGLGVTGNDFTMDVTLGPVFRRSHRMLLDVEFDMTSYTGEIDASASMFSVVPHYVFDKGKWNFDLGLRLSAFDAPDSDRGFYSTKGQGVYPDIHVRYSVLEESLGLFAEIGGGNRLNTYSSLLERNSHFEMTYNGGIYDLLDNTVERINMSIGAEGRISSRFSYVFRGGYVNFKNTPLESVWKIGSDGGSNPPVYMPGMGYTSLQSLYAGADILWKSDDLQVDGTVMYNHAFGFDRSEGILAPAALTGDVSVEYNWKRRIYAGVGCEFSTERKGVNYTVGAYADLSLYAEYQMSRKLSFWFKGSNLLFMPVQRNPFYAEKGASFTLGLCLELQ